MYLKWIGMGAAAVALFFTYAIVTSRPPKGAHDPPQVFEDHWPVMKKADRLPVVEPQPPVVQPSPSPAIVMQQDQELTQGNVIITNPKPKQEEEAPRRHHEESNICTRHGMHKVITRGGRSWRCQK